MGNLLHVEKKDETWKQQNKEMQENPAYKFANLAKGGSLIDAYRSKGPLKVMEIAEKEMSNFFYNKDGKSHHITECEYLKYKWKYSQRVAGLDNTEKVSDETLRSEYVEDYFNKFIAHDACWDLEKRGGVGETPFHLLYLMDTPVHFEVARILLEMYPNLALDVYEGEEYYGESALHIAIVIGDFELVQMLVKAGANVNQRATGRFFLPEDQKKGYTGQTNYEGYAYYGEYPLAFAACLGNKDIYDYLLDHGANPNLQDSFGNTVLHMVVVSDQSDMYKYAVRHHKHPASTVIKNKQNLSPLTLACKLGRHSIFKEMLDIDSIEFWRFSTTMCSAHPLRTLDSIGPDGSTNWSSALMIIVNGEKEDHLEMLEGGVMRQLLIEKWKTFAKSRFMIRLILAIIHLALFSVSIYTRPMGSDLLGYKGSVDAVRYTSESIVCLSCLSTVFYEVKEFSTQGMTNFFRNCAHAPAQTVYLISCLLVLACIPFRFTGQYNVEDVLLILAAPCVWFFLLFFARGYMLTGPFVTMIYKMIAGDLLRFGIIYLIFLSGFTQGFYFLFQDAASHTDNTDLAKFSTFPETILNLFQMTLGEFKYDVFNFAHYAPLTKIIFAFFMILVPILLLNMLIAMMGNTYTQVISKSTKEWWKQWAKIVVVLEWGISRKNLLEFQRAYSVKLAGVPQPVDGNLSPPEERALVVIKTCFKSRAKTRKDALFRWKTLGKEVIRQLRKKKEGQPFELEESLIKGQLLAGINQAILSSTVAQLAWEKDIDLTKGQAFVPDPDNIDIASQCHHSSSNLDTMQQYLNSSLVVTEKGADHGQVSDSKSEHENNENVLGHVRKRRSLVCNRVSPRFVTTTEKDKTVHHDTFENVAFKDSEKGTASFEFQCPVVVKAERHARNRASSLDQQSSTTHQAIAPMESHLRIIPFAALTDTYSASEMRRNVEGISLISKQLEHQTQIAITDSSTISHIKSEIHTSLSHENNVHSIVQYDTFKVHDIESSITASSEKPSAAICWTEDTSTSAFERKRERKKDKMKARYKGRRKGRDKLNGSNSSVVTLIESAGSSRSSIV